MFVMTRDIFGMFIERSFRGGNLTELLSVACLIGAVVSGISLFVKPANYTTDQQHKSAAQSSTDNSGGAAVVRNENLEEMVALEDAAATDEGDIGID